MSIKDRIQRVIVVKVCTIEELLFISELLVIASVWVYPKKLLYFVKLFRKFIKKSHNNWDIRSVTCHSS